MKWLSSQKTEYLLQASFDVLYEESKEWLDELAFMNEEISFFHALLQSKRNNEIPTSEETVLSKKLVSLKVELSGQFYKRLNRHSSEMADMMRTFTMGRHEPYRNEHLELGEEMNRLRIVFKKIKQDIFNCVNHGEGGVNAIAS